MRSISKLSQIGNYSVLAMANKECEWMNVYINLPAEVKSVAKYAKKIQEE